MSANITKRTVNVGCAVLLVILGSYLGGCTTVVRSSMEEARNHPNRKIIAIEVPVAITGADLRTGGAVAFNGPTGDYRATRQELHGIDSLGDSVVIPLKQTSFVHLRSIDNLTGMNTAVPTDSFFLNYGKFYAPTANGALYSISKRLKFSIERGAMDTVTNTITGESEDGFRVNVHYEDVMRVESRQFSVGRTLLASVLVVAVICAIYEASQPNWNIDWHYEGINWN